LRKKNKITQQKLAGKISMRQSHTARLENGEVRPSLKILKRYASGLGQIVPFNIIPMKEYYKSFHSV
jgi:transcriptional regulator with XRE-family HTH domain